MKIIGVPKERALDEERVALAPINVKKLIKKGFQVVIEQGAGIKANFPDQQYIDAGATVFNTDKELYQGSDIILKVQPITAEELTFMRAGQVLMSYLNPAVNQDLLKAIANKGVHAVAMDAIPRISRAQKMDVLSSMANIAGYRSVIEAASHFDRFLNGQITAAGKVEPAKVLVIGAGVAGLAAIGTARSLGAIVRAFDTRMEVAEQIQSMGAKFLTVDIEEDGSTDSGYSKVMSKEFIEAEMALFKEQAQEVDIIITTAQIPGRKAPELILKEHIEVMKPGSIVVDLAASTGGNCVLTKPGEVYTTDNGVVIVGKIDQLAPQASQLYGNNLTHLLDDMGGGENFHIDMKDEIISRAMVTYDGEVNWPPEPLPVSPQKKQTESTAVSKEKASSDTKGKSGYSSIIQLAVIGVVLYVLGMYAPSDFMQHFTVFVLSVFVGWQVIWNVSHSLHTPLMAVTNAISGIIIIGGLLQVTNDLTSPISILALIAIFVASINIVGGFVVTHRMLKMFRK